MVDCAEDERCDPRTVYGPNQYGEPDTGTLAERARPALDELRRLGLGRVAPEIEGRDIDGRHFNLSDYRGRVVVLTFSGTWCGPCKAMYPHQREIVARLKARPFALLSVMTDEDAGSDPARKSRQARSLGGAGGSGAGPTARSPPHGTYAAIRPSTCSIHQGVIRLKFTGLLGRRPRVQEGPQPPIDEFIERLLNEQRTHSGKGTHRSDYGTMLPGAVKHEI